MTLKDSKQLSPYMSRAIKRVKSTKYGIEVEMKDSHEALVKLILEETPTPIAFGQYDQYLVLHHLSKLGEAKVKPLLDDRQWAQIKVSFDQARGMEQFLIQQGLLPKNVGEAELMKAVEDRPADAARP